MQWKWCPLPDPTPKHSSKSITNNQLLSCRDLYLDREQRRVHAYYADDDIYITCVFVIAVSSNNFLSHLFFFLTVKQRPRPLISANKFNKINEQNYNEVYSGLKGRFTQNKFLCSMAPLFFMRLATFQCLILCKWKMLNLGRFFPFISAAPLHLDIFARHL